MELIFSAEFLEEIRYTCTREPEKWGQTLTRDNMMLEKQSFCSCSYALVTISEVSLPLIPGCYGVPEDDGVDETGQTSPPLRPSSGSVTHVRRGSAHGLV